MDKWSLNASIIYTLIVFSALEILHFGALPATLTSVFCGADFFLLLTKKESK